MSWSSGDAVEAKDELDSKWYPATVESRTPAGTYWVQFAEFGHRQNTREDWVRAASMSVVMSARPLSMEVVRDAARSEGEEGEGEMRVVISPRPMSMQVVEEDDESRALAALADLKRRVQLADSQASEWRAATSAKRQQRESDEARAAGLRTKLEEQRRAARAAKLRPEGPPVSSEEQQLLLRLKGDLEAATRDADMMEKRSRRSSWIAPESLSHEVAGYRAKLDEKRQERAELERQVADARQRNQETRAALDSAKASGGASDSAVSEDVLHYRKSFASVDALLQEELHKVAELKQLLDGDLEANKKELNAVESDYEAQIADLKRQLEDLRV